MEVKMNLNQKIIKPKIGLLYLTQVRYKEKEK